MFCLAVVLVATVAALGSAQLPDQAYQDPYFGGYPAVYAGYPSGQYQEAYQGVQQPVSQPQQSTFPGVQQGIYHDPATSLGFPAALSFPTIAPVTCAHRFPVPGAG
ncbi:uncharacterized protein LOC121867810 [Homarus americanus]|uniref:uncharacterized protein LOC121867810 n=1 Tax=Homarus americanus TaxID=6706 RepID=UPI001C48A31C|nr:uncharacterized protein LOC121867810 [Homarus americanus]